MVKQSTKETMPVEMTPLNFGHLLEAERREKENARVRWLVEMAIKLSPKPDWNGPDVRYQDLITMVSYFEREARAQVERERKEGEE